ncbi:MAG: DUF946 domain-containing protein [Proteobacteria bacterium]|nr:MAG: DUF946 domain-containing protein [Pseudomonadota bacterium]
MKARMLGYWRTAAFVLGISIFFALSSPTPLFAGDWTPSTSDENGENSPARCDNGLVTGLACSGRYCDNVSLQCSDNQATEGRDWSPYFSEENNEGYTCPNGEFIQSVRCSGKFCDNVSVRCAKALEVESDPNSCYWRPGVSEEGGGKTEFGTGTHLRGLRCRGKYCDALETYVCPTQEKICDSEECKAEQARKFAPVLKFDQEQANANKCFPSDAGQYWDTRKSGNRNRVCNESADSLLGGQIPIYYEYKDCSQDSTVIMYWFFYGFQDTCSPGMGSHNADWERVAVKIKNGRLERVLYFQHGGSYTRQGNDMQVVDGTHPVAYVGKNSHGSYHDDGGSGSCLYFEDYRNQGGKQYSLNTWDNLVPLSEQNDSPEWMKSWDNANFDGIPSPLRRGINLCSMPGCQGNDVKIGSALCLGQCGCSKSSIGSMPF